MPNASPAAIRRARAGDAALAELFGQLGYPVSKEEVRARLVVREALRSSGVGAALLDAAEKLAWEAGCSHVELSSSEKRTRAHAFYERQGFEEVRKRLVKRRPSPG